MGAFAQNDAMFATSYGADLLRLLDCPVPARLPVLDHPAISWKRSGLMDVTGFADGPPLMSPIGVTAAADGALLALKSLAPDSALHDMTGAQLLGERARLNQYTRRGTISAGGSCRLFETMDGAIAVNLARQDDWISVPAWLEADVDPTWESLYPVIRMRSRTELIERGRLLGLAVAADIAAPEQTRLFRVAARGSKRTAHTPQPLVIDLSALWAGPLCGHLLHKMGARVIKVEGTTRPDGARQGNEPFYDLMNAGKQSVALDVTSQEGRAGLKSLLDRADIVIESNRPRALQQLGISPEALISQRPGLTWISITGYGRMEPRGNWIGFGDDAAVGGGLTAAMRAAHHALMFCGDAIADPLTGLHAALLAWASYKHGGGRLISLALSDVVAHIVSASRVENLSARIKDWSQMVEPDMDLYPMRPTPEPARSLGADTAHIMRSQAEAC